MTSPHAHITAGTAWQLCDPALVVPPQAAWPEHKASHKAGPHTWAYVVQRGKARTFAMPPFNWTGTLRPTMVSPRREVRWRLLNSAMLGHAALFGHAAVS